jgi:NurA domain
MLDFTPLQPQLENFAAKLQHESRAVWQTLSVIKKFFEPDGVMDKAHHHTLAHAENISAEPIETPSTKVPLPPRPPELSLCAVDGSQIYDDRRYGFDFFLLNMSRICFHIGTDAPPVMQSRSTLYDADETRTIFDAESEPDWVVSGDKINALRQVIEIEMLAELASETLAKLAAETLTKLAQESHTRPILALGDGTLICWMLKNSKPLVKRYLGALAAFRENKIPVASYMSSPNYREVVKAVETLAAAELNANGIEHLGAVDDQKLFSMILAPGERSAVFKSRSDMLSRYAESDKIYFFYLHTGFEIARIEFPLWQMETGTLALMHAALYDDLQKGSGYPMTLTEAHEQAVVKQYEKEHVYALLEKLCMNRGFAVSRSAKVTAKRVAKI